MMDHQPTRPPVVTTKLHRPPVAPDAVARARLHELLHGCLDVPLTLVSAPAGYGKSALISHWLEKNSLPAAWLSLDEGDANVETFLEYLVAGIRTLRPDACTEIGGLLATADNPPREILERTLINDLNAIDDNWVLVLDDYHRITGSAIHNLMDEILEHPPKSLHLVIASRQDPPLKLARMRGRGQLVDVRMQDLRFTPDEVKAFLRSVSGGLEVEGVVEKLVDAVEGWAAGLRLVVLASRYQVDPVEFLGRLRAGIPSTREYLLEEVLAGQTPAFRSCLLRTAVLDRFCADLCDVLFENPEDSQNGTIDGQSFIANIVCTGLFAIELDAQGRWYRFHHLFRDLLVQQLRKHSSEDQVADLHLRASRWFEGAGYIDEALEHASSAGRPEQAARLIKAISQELLSNEQTSRLESLLNKIPQMVLEKDPSLLILTAYVNYQRLRMPEWAAAMAKAQALIDSTPSSDGEKMGLQAGLDALQSAHCYWLSDLEQAEVLARRAISNLPKDHQRLRVYATLALAAALQATGRHHEAMSGLQAALADERNQNPRCIAHIHAGMCLVSWVEGDLPEMRRCAGMIEVQSQGTGLIQHREWARIYTAVPRYYQNDLDCIEDLLSYAVERPYTVATVLYIDFAAILALTHCSRQRYRQALEVADQMGDYGLEISNAIVIRAGEALKAEIDLQRGNLETARRWARAFTEMPLQAKYSAYLPELTLARVLLELDSKADRERLSDLLNKLESYAREVHFRPVLIQVLALRALMLDRQGDRQTALEHLDRAIEEAGPGHGVRFFAGLGSRIVELLQELSRHGRTGFADEVLAEIDETGSAPAVPPETWRNGTSRVPSGPSSPDELTNRELDILELLAKRLQNKEIAARLCISTHTVGAHLKRIYQKLDVHGRRQAVERAIETGILDRRPPG